MYSELHGELQLSKRLQQATIQQQDFIEVISLLKLAFSFLLLVYASLEGRSQLVSHSVFLLLNFTHLIHFLLNSYLICFGSVFRA